MRMSGLGRGGETTADLSQLRGLSLGQLCTTGPEPLSRSPALPARAGPASPRLDAEGGYRVYTGRR